MDTEQKNYTLAEVIEGSFDFSDYSAEEKESVIEETTGMIMESTMLRLLDESGEELQEKFGALIETNPTEEQMTTFVTENFPTFNEVLVDEIKIFKSMGEETAEVSGEKTA